jgi:hypothetical protein
MAKKLDIQNINDRKFINGIMCNDAGIPITVLNGYSQEDEDNARRSYTNSTNTPLSDHYCKGDKIIYREDTDTSPLR